MDKAIQKHCIQLRRAYEDGLLGNQIMPEDTHPVFASEEEKLSYFTLPMSLNYQRNSYALWEAAKLAFEDPETKAIFSVDAMINVSQDRLRQLLTKYKVALQPNKHVNTWYRIATTISNEWGSIENMLSSLDYDFFKNPRSNSSYQQEGISISIWAKDIALLELYFRGILRCITKE
jgi:hypothetical protein